MYNHKPGKGVNILITHQPVIQDFVGGFVGHGAAYSIKEKRDGTWKSGRII